MELNDEIRQITKDHIELINHLVPQSLPPASRLMEKRRGRGDFFLKAGKLGMAYLMLFGVFISISIFLINSLKSDNVPGTGQILNAAIFSTDHPGSLVTAFREATE